MNEKNEVEAILAIGRDITDRKEAEAALRKSEERYRILADTMKEGLGVQDKKGLAVYANDRLCEMLAYQRDEILGRPITDFLDEISQGLYRERIGKEQKGEFGSYELKMVRKDGKRIDTIVSPNVIRGESGEYEGAFAVVADITGRKQLEDALKSSEARLRTAIDCLPFDFFMMDKNECYEMVNLICRERWGDVIGKRPEDLKVDKESLAIWKENNRRALSGETVRGEVVLTTDGKKGYYYNIISPIKSKEEIKGILGVNIDVTRLKLTEEALRRSEQKYRELVETMNEGMGIQDEDGMVTYANDKLCQMLGYSQKEVIGRPVTEFIHEDYIEFFQKLKDRRRKGKLEAYEIGLVGKDGKEVYSLISPRAVFDKIGKFRGTFAVMTDITERKRIEEALSESEEKYRTLVQQSQQGILILTGPPPRIVFANPAMSRILGYSVDKIKSLSPKEMEDLAHPEFRGMLFSRFRDRIMGKKVPASYEALVMRRGGELIWIDVSSTRIDYQGRPAIQATFIDITDRKLAEQELRKAHDELEERVKERTTELNNAFKELEIKSQSLEEANTALKVLLEKRDQDRTELEEKLIVNLNQLVEPYLEKLKNSNLDERQKAFLDIVKSNLENITSPFIKSLASQHLRLTPTEIQVTELIKQGRNSKEIGTLMNLSWKTVKTHRRNIRSKLGLNNKKTNLRSYLMSYQQ